MNCNSDLHALKWSVCTHFALMNGIGCMVHVYYYYQLLFLFFFLHKRKIPSLFLFLSLLNLSCIDRKLESALKRLHLPMIRLLISLQSIQNFLYLMIVCQEAFLLVANLSICFFFFFNKRCPFILCVPPISFILIFASLALVVMLVISI